LLKNSATRSNNFSSETAVSNVSIVRCEDLCLGCGVCESICPQEAVKMIVSNDVYLPEVAEERCTKCGLCVRICPGWQINYDNLNEFCFSRDQNSPALGRFLDCYVGHSADRGVRWKASSGGIVTTLLVHALRKGIIDGAVVSVIDHNDPFTPKALVACNEERLYSSTGSKYCPISFGAALKEVLVSEGKFAVVGLPCLLHGLRKAEMSNDNLRKRIVLHIGLFCSNMITFEGTQCLMRRYNVNKDGVNSLTYRSEGWPGKMLVCLKDGTRKMIPYKQYWDCLFGLHFFTPWRCISCVDATSEVADLSVGDPWLPEFKDERKGKSIVIVRTKEGQELLKGVESSGVIELSRLAVERVEYSQFFTLKSKKRAVATRVSIMRKLRRAVPRTYPPPVSGGVGSYLSAALIIGTKVFSSQRPFSLAAKYTPFPVLNAYFKLLCATLLVA
jgi:coenzyme F420 hydrogenase subunit beta